MESLFESYKLKDFIIKKPRKDETKLVYRERLSELLGRTKKSVWGSTIIWTEEMLKDSIRACENFSDIKARNWHFNEYKAKTKIQ
jgi:hypothetical protein